MITSLTQLASGATEAEQAGGIAALGIDLKAFLFQLITFVFVLLFLKKFVYTKLVDTLEKRHDAVVDSLEAAKKAAEDLSKAEEKVSELLAEARKESADIIATAHKEATSLVEEAETKARKKAEAIVSEARVQLDGEILKARTQLQKETKALVAAATEKIIGEKLTSSADEKLIERALAEAK